MPYDICKIVAIFLSPDANKKGKPKHNLRAEISYLGDP